VRVFVPIVVFGKSEISEIVGRRKSSEINEK